MCTGGRIMKKTSQFKNYLQNESLTFVMETHNALSAKIAQNAGFKALWASSLTISTAHGVRDCNELSWSQVLDAVRYMVDATNIPILLDGDSGYGDYNNVRILVKNLCQMDVAAVCLEDKLFPKTNSFVSRNQQLASIEEFTAKIKAGKDIQSDNDFSIIARTEALICGEPMQEALRRAEAYYAAGADAILIHSKESTAAEIVEFAHHWNNRCPLVIVPTKYYKTPTQAFKDAKISMVIWANHSLRASIKAMENVCTRIMQDESLVHVEDSVTSLNQLFDLVNQDELDILDKLYR